ncbi:MAG: hypothetical protein DDT28_00655 [Dehalococcoidia bacterium]|nr:hypothetical protein [Chloroflexota bacterium]
MGIYGKLNIRAPGFNAYFPHDLYGSIAHLLIFPVGQRLSRGTGDAVAGVNPHGIQILYRADDNHVVGQVPHHLKLIFLPTQDRLLDKNLPDAAGLYAPGGYYLQLLPVEGYSAPGSPQGVGRPDNHGVADLLGNFCRLFRRISLFAPRSPQAYPFHCLLEENPIFGLSDCLELGPDKLHVIFLEDSPFGELGGDVQSNLTAEGGEESVRSFFLDYFFDHLWGQWFDVSRHCHLRVGHDRCRVRIDQNDFIALLPQRLASLAPGVIELAALPDDDRAGPDEQDPFYIRPSWHSCPPCLLSFWVAFPFIFPAAINHMAE